MKTKFTDGFIPQNEQLIEDPLFPNETVTVVTRKGVLRKVLPLWKGDRFCVHEDLLTRNIYQISHNRSGLGLDNALKEKDLPLECWVAIAEKWDQSEILKEMDQLPRFESVDALQDFIDLNAEKINCWKKELDSIDSVVRKAYFQSAVEQ